MMKSFGQTRINFIQAALLMGAVGLFISYNPGFIHVLLKNGALGCIRIRIVLSVLGLSLLALFVLTTVFLRKNRLTISMLPFPFIFFLFFVNAAFLGITRGSDLAWFGMDFFPLFEFFSIYFLLQFIPFRMDGINFRTVILFVWVWLSLMAITDLSSYSYLTFYEGRSFGALRALIGDVTVNRLLDFIIPLFAPVLLYVSLTRPNKAIVFSTVLIFSVVMLTFYRTVYLAVMLGMLYFVLFGKLDFRQMNKQIWGVLLLISLLLILGLFFGENGTSFVELVSQRFYSVFDRTDYASTGRISHNLSMLEAVSERPVFGIGLGGEYELANGKSSPVSVSSNYFLQLILLLGIPAGMLFIYLYSSVFLKAVKLARSAQCFWESIFFHSCASSLVVMSVILLLFPYTQQFPLLYLLGFITALVSRYYRCNYLVKNK